MTTRPYLIAFLAASATLALTRAHPCLAEDDLGRLFFTPERRQALDNQRQFNIQDKAETQEDPMLTINGVVTRSNGKRTVWFNGIPQDEKDTGSNVVVTPYWANPGKVVVQPHGAPAANASVGDTVNRNTGEKADLLGSGQLTVKRRQ